MLYMVIPEILCLESCVHLKEDAFWVTEWIIVMYLYITYIFYKS